jgi:hypothetical protein
MKNLFGMMRKEKLYFGHPVNFYNTPIEERLIGVIQQTFPGCEVISPHLAEHQEGYKKFKLERENGMLYFYEKVLPKMDSGIFLPFDDGLFGAGVFKEAAFLHERQKPVWQINLNGLVEVLDVRVARALSVEETRKRVYGQ